MITRGDVALLLLGFLIGTGAALWLYGDQSPYELLQLDGLPQDPIVEGLAISDGLPVSRGPRPAWLLREDLLAVDARPPPERRADGGVLIVMASLPDAGGAWGKGGVGRPQWLRACLAANWDHARRHGHAVVLRTRPTEPQLTAWQEAACGATPRERCARENERENFNWEKHLFLSDYLESPENFSHVLMLDADAVLAQPGTDTLRQMAEELDRTGRDLFLADEDWLLHGEGRINGGLLFAKNTPFSRALFRDTFEAHVRGPAGLEQWRVGVTGLGCASNEQICLDVLYRGSASGKRHFTPHVIVSSGTRYNRGACVLHGCSEPIIKPEQWKVLGMDDRDMEVVHFMGGSKRHAAESLCGKADLISTRRLRSYACLA